MGDADDAALVLVVVIVAVAANGHRLAGLLAALSAAAWFDFFLTAPHRMAWHGMASVQWSRKGTVATTASVRERSAAASTRPR
jgi:K+-sensing histidine kinase KdpD